MTPEERQALSRYSTGVYTEDEAAVDQDFKDMRTLAGLAVSLHRELTAILTEPIEWTGDLADDCTARWRGLVGRTEMMGVVQGSRAGSEEKTEVDHWWWSVIDEQGNEAASQNTEGGWIDGINSRRLCESIMRLAAIRKVVGL